MEMKRYAWATAQFEVVHRWPEAPAHSAYQRGHHRHIMKVRVEKELNTDEPPLDRIQFKHQLEGVIVQCLQLPGQPGPGAAHETWSTDDWAQKLLEVLDADRVEVSEDGELGALAVRQGRVLTAQAAALPASRGRKLDVA